LVEVAISRSTVGPFRCRVDGGKEMEINGVLHGSSVWRSGTKVAVSTLKGEATHC